VPPDLDLHGVWVPLITPFDGGGAVDTAAIERLAHEYLDAGARGIVALGTTGESPALDGDEKAAVVATTASVCAERDAPLVVGTGTNSTRTTIAATRALAGTPALVAALVVTPYYVRPSTEGIVEHFTAVADASPVPLVLYNIPARTGRAISASTMIELSRHANIVGVKQALATLDPDTLGLFGHVAPGFQVLGGEDTLLLPTVLMGGVGAICASAHVCTQRFVAMIECGIAGKLDDGRAHAEALLPVVQACFAEPNPAVFKGVLHAEGRIATPDLRAPMMRASTAAIDQALAAIEAASV
jgi:4-hydroxy-tetrahydrodipicolinate synthase